MGNVDCFDRDQTRTTRRIIYLLRLRNFLFQSGQSQVFCQTKSEHNQIPLTFLQFLRCKNHSKESKFQEQKFLARNIQNKYDLILQ